MTKSSKTARCVASMPGGSCGGDRNPPAEATPCRSCLSMLARMLHTMSAGMSEDGSETGGHSRVSAPLGPEIAPSGANAGRGSGANAAATEEKSAAAGAAATAPAAGPPLGAEPPASHCSTAACSSPVTATTPPSKKGEAKMASAPARFAGGNATSRSRANIPSGPNTLATLSKFRKMSSLSGCACIMSCVWSGRLRQVAARVTWAKSNPS
mmetsp:Transcript_19079/g.54758  ORF Transcript_19079/g.54758 Transcript_19079/m.54758 type:complete len:211 (-) Transcript_19079:1269-1901(-)